MKRILLTVIVAGLLSGCNIVTDQTHDMYNDLPDVDIAIDLGQIEMPEEETPVNIHVTSNGEALEDADVKATIWWIRDPEEEEGTTYTLDYNNDGYYTTDVIIPHEGLFYIETSVEYEEINAHPVKYFTVGELDMFEHVFLEELAEDDDEIDIEGHH